MQGARALVEVLAESGVQHVFGLPGHTGMAFDYVLHEIGAIEHVMTRDERSASFMAEMRPCRVSGRVGVCESEWWWSP